MIQSGDSPSPGERLARRLATSDPIYVDLGDGLGRLTVWTEAQWDALDPAERPARAEHLAGLGWVVAVPIRDLN